MSDLYTSILRARSAIAKLRGAATAPRTRKIEEFEVAELSLVDHPAGKMNGRPLPLLILKRSGAAPAVFQVLKANVAEQFVLGVALAPTSESAPDSQGDYYSADTIRKAAHQYLANSRSVGLMHKKRIDEFAKVVESFIAPTPMKIGGVNVAEGSWLVGLKIEDPGLWAEVKSGRLGGFSIGGWGRSSSKEERR